MNQNRRNRYDLEQCAAQKHSSLRWSMSPEVSAHCPAGYEVVTLRRLHQIALQDPTEFLHKLIQRCTPRLVCPHCEGELIEVTQRIKKIAELVSKPILVSLLSVQERALDAYSVKEVGELFGAERIIAGNSLYRIDECSNEIVPEYVVLKSSVFDATKEHDQFFEEYTDGYLGIVDGQSKSVINILDNESFCANCKKSINNPRKTVGGILFEQIYQTPIAQIVTMLFQEQILDLQWSSMYPEMTCIEYVKSFQGAFFRLYIETTQNCSGYVIDNEVRAVLGSELITLLKNQFEERIMIFPDEVISFQNRVKPIPMPQEIPQYKNTDLLFSFLKLEQRVEKLLLADQHNRAQGFKKGGLNLSKRLNRCEACYETPQMDCLVCRNSRLSEELSSAMLEGYSLQEIFIITFQEMTSELKEVLDLSHDSISGDDLRLGMSMGCLSLGKLCVESSDL